MNSDTKADKKMNSDKKADRKMNSDKKADKKMKKGIKPDRKLSKSKSKHLETSKSKHDMMMSPSVSKKKHKFKKSKLSVGSKNEAKQSQSIESESPTTKVTVMGKTSKKRKNSEDNHEGAAIKQIKLSHDKSKDCNSTTKQPVTSVSATGLTRKQRRNRKKNNSKKNKYKHLANSSNSTSAKIDAETSSLSNADQDFKTEKSSKSPITPKQKKKKSKQQSKALKTSIKCKVLTDSDLPESEDDDDDIQGISEDENDSDCTENNILDNEHGYNDNYSSNAEAKSLKNLEVKSESSTKKSKSASALDKAREKLNSARFRFLNEQLYTSTGAEALQLFQEDPEAFHVYHQGFQQQASRWPLNPLNTITQQLDKMPRSTVIADFGCGDAQLAESLPHHKVHSFDLVASKPSVIACDIAKVPLDDNSINVAVFCLSLMGTNLADYLCEANRVLQTGGTLKIAEVISRFYSVGKFARNVEALGFKLQKKVFLGKMFMLFTFKKVGQASRKRAPRIELRACHYKRR